MKICFIKAGLHIRMRVFMNGANCGSLIMRIDEFREFRQTTKDNFFFNFIDESPDETPRSQQSK